MVLAFLEFFASLRSNLFDIDEDIAGINENRSVGLLLNVSGAAAIGVPDLVPRGSSES